MTVTYTTVNNVEELLGFPNGYFTTSTTPTIATVEKMINRAEDRIDNSTAHAWRSKTVTNEYIEPASVYRRGTGIELHLNHRSIQSITSLEVWEGNGWVDWVATKTEGRNNDYWVDETNGVVYLVSAGTIFPRGVRATYVYGENSVSGGIEDCATMMVALKILNSPEASVVSFTQVGENKMNWDSEKNVWKEEIENIISNNTEFQ